MNTALLEQVARRIVRNPDSFTMDTWVVNPELENEVRKMRNRSDDDYYGDYQKARVKVAKQHQAKPHQPMSCGTTGCIAGWVSVLSTGIEFDDVPSTLIPAALRRKVREFAGHSSKEFEADAQEIATAALGIDMEQASNLFYEQHWPKKFRVPFAKLPKRDKIGRAKIAAARIRHFIKTKGAE